MAVGGSELCACILFSVSYLFVCCFLLETRFPLRWIVERVVDGITEVNNNERDLSKARFWIVLVR